MSPLDAATLALVCAGLMAPLFSLARVRAARAGFWMAIELWTAACLLRLTGEPSWRSIAGVTALLALRVLLLRSPPSTAGVASRPR